MGNLDQNLTLLERLNACKLELQKWANNKLYATPNRIKKSRKELNSLKTCLQWKESAARIREIETEIENLTTMEEIYWKQRSRITWLKEGDRNSRYFHTRATQRKARNNIHGLISSHGDWCTDITGMKEIVLDYFTSIFKTSHPSETDMAQVFNVIQPKVSTQMNQTLCTLFSEKEVRRALFDMHPDKAPGPMASQHYFTRSFGK